jgi:hypothetical protein
MICQHQGVLPPSLSDCKPYYNDLETSITPASVLFSLLQPGGIQSNKNNALTQNFAKLLGGILLNGLPLLSLDDYVILSDFTNMNIKTSMRDEILSSPVLRGRFGNFLTVRNKEIRFTPDNCWTRLFYQYLLETSDVIKVPNIMLLVFIYF